MDKKAMTLALIFFFLVMLTIRFAYASGYVDSYSEGYVTDDNGNYGSMPYHADYEVSDYGSRGDGYYHAYYTNKGYTRIVYDGYGASTSNYRLYNKYYVYDGYGTTSSNNAGVAKTYYVSDGYGSSHENAAGIRNSRYVSDGYGSSYSNKAGIASGSYVYDGYGTSSGRSSSGLTGTYVYCPSCFDDDTHYYNKYVSHGKYIVADYTPVANQNKGSDQYEYKVKLTSYKAVHYTY